jgi:hypothetical protein
MIFFLQNFLADEGFGAVLDRQNEKLISSPRQKIAQRGEGWFTTPAPLKKRLHFPPSPCIINPDNRIPHLQGGVQVPTGGDGVSLVRDRESVEPV